MARVFGAETAPTMVVVAEDRIPIALTESARELAAVSLPLPSVDVSPPGHTLRVAWAGVYGATEAEVERVTVSLGPALAVGTAQLPVSNSGNARDLAIPSGKRLLSLDLGSLRWLHTVSREEGPKEVETPFASESDLRASDLRLVISAPDARGEIAPLFAVPPISARRMLPSMFSGATFSSRTLQLPALDARKVRLALTEGLGRSVQEWEATRIKLGATVTATLGTPATEVELIGPDGATLYTFPGQMPLESPVAEVDLSVPLETALNQKLAGGQPLEVAVVLRGKAGSEAGLRFPGVRGALLRSFPGVHRTALEGEPRSLALPDSRLAEETPASVVADLTVTYAGIRILDTVNDPVPPAGGAGGVIVGEQPVARALPPAALGALPVARVGVIGRAPVACELSVQLVEMIGGAPGAPLGAPGVLTLAPSDALGIRWIEIPGDRPVSGPVGVAVRARRGRFFWASGELPLLKVAVRDRDPGSRPLRIAGATLLAVDRDEIHLPARSLPPAAFRSTLPALESPLFLTVDVSDLVLRYRR